MREYLAISRFMKAYGDNFFFRLS